MKWFFTQSELVAVYLIPQNRVYTARGNGSLVPVAETAHGTLLYDPDQVEAWINTQPPVRGRDGKESP